MVTWERTRDDVGSHGVGDGILSLVGGASSSIVVVKGWCLPNTIVLLVMYTMLCGGSLGGVLLLGYVLVLVSLPTVRYYIIPSLPKHTTSPHYTWSNSTHASLYVPTLYLSHPMSHATYPLCVSILRHAV